VKTGVQKLCNQLKKLDSGFRRNDKKWCFSTFYEFIKLDNFPDMIYIVVYIKLQGGLICKPLRYS
jgi:hypothetical protein